MRKLIAAVTVAAALTLTGCATTTIPPRPAPAQETVPEADMTQLGLDLLRDEYPIDTVGSSDADLLDVANGICGLLDDGGTFTDYLLMVVESGVDPEFGGALFAFAVLTQCTEHERILTGLGG